MVERAEEWDDVNQIWIGRLKLGPRRELVPELDVELGPDAAPLRAWHEVPALEQDEVR